MAGRNKQPLQVIIGNGRSKHLTKDEMKKRQKHEEKMRGPTENIEIPSYLTAAQKKEFTEIAEKLVALEIFSELDVDLARYLDSKHQYLQLVKDIRKIKPTETVEQENGKKITIVNDDYPKLQRTKNTLFNECRSAAADLGLTITSRLKLVIPSPSTVEGKSEAQKRFKCI
ncbi:phage terminase small subunit P27 family [Lysinibacillus sp. BPa_S21]|uniref:phage terminase small subunit P27 family n=1 Tax=Lysinibacillus sp. BPa_S21 TaxID=2932478 RepID=UPI002013BE2E|nr:phage terminase small subunit P27 family [Lysinibacillus sp. BPa_S21]MCL1698203.1 phage terminase small subunit P27 family [Lysinibacillus sp. BPa_S21]